jgi:hypothetical protein
MSTSVTHLRVADAHRPSPALPPMNVPAYVHSILEAANSLLRNNFEVVAFEAAWVGLPPVIWIKDTPHTRDLARVGVASYDRSGNDENGPYRIGCFERDGVKVQWFERVPS